MVLVDWGIMAEAMTKRPEQAIYQRELCGMKRIEFPAWYGELGWEVMTWIPVLRRQARDYDAVIATSFAGMGPLYADFVSEFREHNQTNRSLCYPKAYRIIGDHIRYGDPSKALAVFDVLIHARGITRKNAINYRRWAELGELFHRCPWSIGWIGSPADQALPACGFDLRGRPLDSLIDIIAGSRCVIGVSSGLMHLAAACGTDLVVWGDRRTYFGETLETRYKQTWNPHNVAVGWIDADDWQPEPGQIISQIERMLER